MNLKKITKNLSSVRDSIDENGEITPEDEQALKDLVSETIAVAKNDLKDLREHGIEMPKMPIPHNDNQPLTTEQRFRLSLMEKTGTGSFEIH